MNIAKMYFLKCFIFILVSLVCWRSTEGQECWNTKKASHGISVPNPKVSKYLSDCLSQEENFKNLLNPLMVTRVPGSPGNSAAQNHIVQTLEKLGWTIEKDTFTENTVIGQKTFTNIIATLHPDSPRRLVLAAHFDSKLTPEGFIGATDSAVPCAMMLDLATTLKDLFYPFDMTPELTLQLIFFDGEEAFQTWTDTDSLYGSRHLAEKWANTPYTVKQGLGFCQNEAASELDRIDTFVLLDLLGTKDVSFTKFTTFDTNLFDRASMMEEVVRMVTCGERTSNPLLQVNKAMSSYIQDDHLPFYNKGVNRILHLISTPFPDVWHTINDDESALHYPTIEYLNKLMRNFVFGYLNIPVQRTLRKRRRGARECCNSKSWWSCCRRNFYF